MYYLRLFLSFFAVLLFLELPSSVRAEETSPYLGDSIDAQVMSENLCALTFDDGPGPFTHQLLDKLDEYGIPATFFMLGRNAARFPDIVRRALDEGHEVENHSFSHPNMKSLSAQRRYEEMSRTNDILRSLGADPVLLRPPYGLKDAALITQAAELGLRVITWSRDSLDWKRLPSDYSKLPDSHGNITPQGQLRGIFLFHDIHKKTVEDLPRIVAQLRAGGCQRFVTVRDYIDIFFLDHEPAMLMTRRAPGAAVRGRDASQNMTDSGKSTVGEHIAAASTSALMPGTPSLSSWPGLAIDDPAILVSQANKTKTFFGWFDTGTPSKVAYRPATWKPEASHRSFRIGDKVNSHDLFGNEIYICPIGIETTTENTKTANN